MGGFNTYLTIHDYIREPTGQEVASLIGNLFKVSAGGIAIGAVSLPATPATTVNLAINDLITIFDGSNSEIVTVTATTAAGASTIPISATQFAHAAGTSCASDGRLGSLCEAIIEGSAEVERICYQPLLTATNTNETLSLLTSRAMIDNQYQLIIRPRQRPVQSVSAISIQFGVGNTMSVDTAQVVIQTPGKLVKVPVVKTSGSGNNYQLLGSLDNQTTGDVLITYVAGYDYTSLPYEIRRAAVLLVSDHLSDRANPTGAADYQIGKMHTSTFLRGDLTGESALVKRARKKLQPYIAEAF